MHFVERSGASTVFLAWDEAIPGFASCEQGRIYEVEVPSKCVRLSSGEHKYGVRCKFEVVFKFPFSLSKSAWPLRFPYKFCDWEALNQATENTNADIIGVILQTLVRALGASLPKLSIDLGNGGMKQTVVFMGSHASLNLLKM